MNEKTFNLRSKKIYSASVRNIALILKSNKLTAMKLAAVSFLGAVILGESSF